ncbi:putative oxidoreductase [alpha proteobacterium BAL199]|nr:putative oxidoreductase [alpha proteobacterium BAL199]
MLDRERPDGVIVAAPNQLHLAVGLACVERGIPALVEKPLADTLDAGAELVLAAEAKGVPLLVGHHRRYNPMVEATREILARGELGRLVAVNAMWSARKPDAYFDAAWRRAPGGGPILINMIHDIDCLRHFCGEIAEVQAFGSSAVRRFEVEDTAVVALRFASGALATVTLTDAAPSPWGWEAGSADNPGIAASGQNCYRFLGTEAALDFPNLTLWRGAGDEPASWGDPLTGLPRTWAGHDALPRQLEHFVNVIAGTEAPRVSGREGLATLAATLAVKQAIATRQPVAPAPPPPGATA